MALTRIEYGSLASSEVMNNNFEYLDNRISAVNTNMGTNNAGISSTLASINSLISTQGYQARPIGQPIIRLDNTLLEDEIRLEGAEVSRTTYASLFEIYSVTYGSGDGVTTFNLPDFRGRVFWGGENSGYLEPELPNIKGSINDLVTYSDISNWSGVFSSTWTDTWRKSGTDQTLRQSHMKFNASKSSAIYKDNGTVRPPAVQIRVVTRYR